MKLKIKSDDPLLTQDVAQKLMEELPKGSVVLLEGDLGSGKTTFTKGVGKALGIKRAIKSPTYTIIKEYPLEDGGLLVHVDAYRLEESSEDTVDLLYYLTDQNYTFIEWSQYVEDALPQDYLKVHFIPQEALNERVLIFEPEGMVYENVVSQLEERLGHE